MYSTPVSRGTRTGSRRFEASERQEEKKQISKGMDGQTSSSGLAS
jgi:hypothetical protein